MAKVSVSEDLSTTADSVWKLVRDFGGIRQWAGPMIQDVSVEGEGVGAVRTLSLGGGNTIQEELRAYDDDERMFQYAIVGESPIPVEDYLSTFRVVETGAEACRIDWSSTFEPAGVAEEQARTMVEGIYTGGIAGIKKSLQL